MLVTHETDGFMSKDDKITLDKIAAKTNTDDIKIFNFYDESLEWVILHNQNTSNFIVQVYDDNNTMIFANIEIIDENKFSIRFTTPARGTAKVLFFV
jgi:hypothetical protein